MRQNRPLQLALTGLFFLLGALSFDAAAWGLRSGEPDLLITEIMAANGSTLADQDASAAWLGSAGPGTFHPALYRHCHAKAGADQMRLPRMLLPPGRLYFDINTGTKCLPD